MNREKLPSLLKELDKTKLIAVSKYRSVEEIMELYNMGQRRFAENRVQALLERMEQLPLDIEWHLIGHLQSKKIKYIAGKVALIHSVDSLKLLKALEKYGTNNSLVFNILLQIKVAQEESKFGFNSSDLLDLLESQQIQELKQVKVKGIMAMATFTSDERQVSEEFSRAKMLFNEIKNKYYPHENSFCECSMGMSADYKIALKHGSTMVRIGSMLFK